MDRKILFDVSQSITSNDLLFGPFILHRWYVLPSRLGNYLTMELFSLVGQSLSSMEVGFIFIDSLFRQHSGKP